MILQAFRRTLLTGVTLIGPPPVGRVHVALGGDVLALYGQNGAGKSRVLRGLAAALRGESVEGMTALVHLTVPEVDDELIDPFVLHLLQRSRIHASDENGRTLAAIRAQRDHEVIEDLGDEFAWGDSHMADFFDKFEDTDFSPWSLRELVKHHVYARQTATRYDVHRFHHLLEGVAGTGHMCLVPNGMPGLPSWSAYAAIGHESAQSAAILDQDRSHWSRMHDVVRAARSEGRDLTRSEQQTIGEGRRFPWAVFSDLAVALLDRDLAPSLLDRVPWPAWATQPLVKIADINAPAVDVVDDASLHDPDELTRAALLRLPSVVALYEETTAVLSDSADAFVQSVGSIATEILREVLPGAPALGFDVGDPHDWLRGRPPCWQAALSEETSVDVGALSHAEARWARIACLTALSMVTGQTPLVFLLDEPEAGLHRTAEARLPRALARIARERAAAVVVATHSPAMINQLLVQPVHVHRALSGLVTTTPLELEVRTDLDREVTRLELGMSPSDLLQLVRVAVVVEGPHDEALLRAMLGLGDDPSTLLLPVGGAKQFPSLTTAHVLWQFTDAAVIVVVDGISRADLQPIWDRVQGALAVGDRRRARHELRALEKLDGGEARWLRELMGRVVESGDKGRLSFEPLSKPDIICYLPERAVLGNRTWVEVTDAWRQAAAPSRPRDLKGFLRNRYGISVGVEKIAEYAAGAPVPGELAEVGMRVREIAAFGHRADPTSDGEV